MTGTVRRALRWTGWVTTALVALLLIALAWAWWWSGTPASLDWALRRMPPGLQVEQATGNLREGVQARQLRWEQDGLTVTVRGLDVGWDVLALLGRRLQIDRLRAESVEVVDERPPQPTSGEPPQDLRLPWGLGLSIDELVVGRLRWQGATPIEVRQIAGSYRYAGDEHQLRLRNAEHDNARVRGVLQLGAQGEMPLEARLQGEVQPPLPGQAPSFPLRFEASAEGPLASFVAKAQLRGPPPAGGDPAQGTPAADLSARVTPWADAPVGEAQAQVQNIDLSQLVPGAPATQLQGNVQLRPAGSGWTAQARLDNARAGPWDRQLLPLSRLSAQGEWQADAGLRVPRFEAQVGDGTATGEGSWSPTQGWRVDTRLKNLDPAALHGDLASDPLSGQLKAAQSADALDFDVDLRTREAPGRGAPATLADAGSPPARPAAASAAAPADWTGLLRALRLRQVIGSGRFSNGVLELADLDVLTQDARLQGTLTARLEERSGQGRLSLRIPGLSASLDGTVAARRGGGQLQAQATDLEQASRWLRALPLVPPDTIPRLTGQSSLDLTWRGGWEDPQLRGRLELARVSLSTDGEAPPLQVPSARLLVDGPLRDARVQLQAQVLQEPVRARLDAAGRLQGNPPGVALELQRLQAAVSGIGAAPGEWQLAMPPQSVTIRWQPEGPVQVGAGSATVSAPSTPRRTQARLAWGPTRWEPGQLSTSGQVQDLPLSWVRLFTGQDPLAPRIAGDLVFAGEWELRLDGQPRLQASLRRTAGDLSLQNPSTRSGPARTQAGIRELQLNLRTDDRQLRAQLQFDSERAGQVEATASTRLVPGGALGWQLPPDPPVTTTGRATGLSLSLVQMLTGTDLLGPRASGDLQFAAQWDANLADPLRLQATIEHTGGDLTFQGPTAGAPRLALGIRRARVTLENDGPQVRLGLEFDSSRAGRVQARASTRLVRGGPVGWELPDRPVIETSGQAEELSLALVDLFSGSDVLGSLVTGDLQLRAQWQARLADTLALQATVERSGGDLTVLAETAGGTTQRVPAGIRQARLQVSSQGNQLRGSLQFDSERAGNLSGEVRTTLSEGGALGWQLPPQAPLDGRVQAQLPTLRAWSVLAPPGWRVRGSLEADVRLAGTVGDPRLEGVITAQDLGVRSVVDGIALQDGRLRALLQGQRVVFEELSFRGAGTDAGTLRATGSAERGPQGLQLDLRARLDRLRASVRSDRQVTVSGDARAQLGPDGVEITGDLRVDRARIVAPDETAPELGDDVVVFNLPPGVQLVGDAGAANGNGRPFRMAVNIDLGNDTRVSGRGIDAGLRGQLRVSGTDVSDPQVNGEIRVVDGEFAAYGQRLEIERGVLRFTGPATNPALDVLAVRPRLEPKVGVLVSGTAQAPDIRLYSSTAMTEAEKLSMLVLGRSSASGGAEAALLQRAALALLSQKGPGGGGGGGGLAGMFGLDELSVRRDETAGAAFVVGRRIANNLYASYERSLTSALGTLFVFYDVTERLTLRAQAGERTSVDLIYRFSYD
ncbi:translocation/assembly module TamB domain-containing protein [Ramlibacter sp. AW1]|uniref:Translocation/assembly module TamB domain-containing protein n=1 Tax=Ramlibacter aurantiacus TaxID=2801330 RepID=A0A937D704_9BURK|nr:translocation/assembly module TamB domain-containing protein [Ramlibacter aurantiacus]MBL0420426.1 translocation/assembly module TamB domain-containing protein [Ramlibacter aurantiacus]